MQPNSATLKDFSEKIEALITMELEIEKQNDKLIKQRNELLPLLMNGQVSLNYHLYECYERNEVLIYTIISFIVLMISVHAHSIFYIQPIKLRQDN